LAIVILYLGYFHWHLRDGISDITTDWFAFCLHSVLVCVFIVSSATDIEYFAISLGVIWFAGFVGLAGHLVGDDPTLPTMGIISGALACGAGIGLLISILLLWAGILRRSFAGPEWGDFNLPVEEKDEKSEADTEKKNDYQDDKETENSQNQQAASAKPNLHKELLWEIAFLMPPILGACIFGLMVMNWPAVQSWWSAMLLKPWMNRFLASAWGLLLGGGIIWFCRLIATFAFRRVAMGMGDIHLMAAAGTVVGAGPAVTAFFVAPFFGLFGAGFTLIFHGRRELPYGPWLSLGTFFTMLFYDRLADRFGPAFEGLLFLLSRWLGSG
jgi:leader peptidase (prepilin peptidase)/N-methyltransferase